MKKNELIEVLQAIEGNPEVCILDWKTNYQADNGDGTSDGVHYFTVDLLGKDDIPDDQEPWIALSFDSPDVDTITVSGSDRLEINYSNPTLKKYDDTAKTL